MFLFLASDLASYVTGAVISVDGAAQTVNNAEAAGSMEPAAWGWCMEDGRWLFAAEIFRYEQVNHVVDGLRVGARVDAGREPVGIRAGEVFLQRVKIAAVAELNMIGRSHRVVAEEQYR